MACKFCSSTKRKSSSGGESRKLQLLKTYITILIHCVCLTVLLFLVTTAIERHVHYDTRALITVKNTRDEKHYCAFTVCPAYTNAYKMEKLRKYGIDSGTFRRGNFTGNATDKNPWDVIQDLTFSIDDLVSVLSVMTESTDDISEGHADGNIIYLLCQSSIKCPSDHLSMKGSGKTLATDGFAWNEKEIDNLYSVSEKYPYSLGRCFEFEFTEELIKRGIMSVQFLSRKGRSIYIYVNTPGQFQSIDEKSKIFTTHGKKHFLDMYYTVHNDRLGPQSKIPCSGEMDSRLDECIYKSTAEDMMRDFNCVLPFLPPNKSQPICTPGTKHQITYYKQSVSNQQGRICAAPCKKMTVSFGLLEKYKNTKAHYLNRSHARIYMKSTVQYTETIMDYSVSNMMAGESICFLDDHYHGES